MPHWRDKWRYTGACVAQTSCIAPVLTKARYARAGGAFGSSTSTHLQAMNVLKAAAGYGQRAAVIADGCHATRFDVYYMCESAFHVQSRLLTSCADATATRSSWTPRSGWPGRSGAPAARGWPSWPARAGTTWRAPGRHGWPGASPCRCAWRTLQRACMMLHAASPQERARDV